MDASLSPVQATTYTPPTDILIILNFNNILLRYYNSISVKSTTVIISILSFCVYFRFSKYPYIHPRFIHAWSLPPTTSHHSGHSGCVFDRRHCLRHISSISGDLTLDPWRWPKCPRRRGKSRAFRGISSPAPIIARLIIPVPNSVVWQPSITCVRIPPHYGKPAISDGAYSDVEGER